jgi:hypothetical protein
LYGNTRCIGELRKDWGSLFMFNRTGAKRTHEQRDCHHEKKKRPDLLSKEKPQTYSAGDFAIYSC